MNKSSIRRLKRIILLLLLPFGMFVIGGMLFTLVHNQAEPRKQQNHPSLPATGEWWESVPGTSWQWQLIGETDPTLDVQMYDIDLFEAQQEVIDQLHAHGRVGICYFSAGTYEDWCLDAEPSRRKYWVTHFQTGPVSAGWISVRLHNLTPSGLPAWTWPSR